MIRILQCVNNMHRAGLETMLMNYYRHIDREKIQFDFLTHRPERSDYDDEIESLGGRMYYAPRLYPQNYPAYFKWMKQFFAQHPEYKIVHSHIDAMSYLPLLAAKQANIPVRIAHSHNTAIDRDYKYLFKQFFRKRINCVATERLSCGAEAGKFLFHGKDYKIIPNAVDASVFCFDESVRNKTRAELGFTNEFIVGHVGRISYQKNHKFLIDIFKKILSINSNAILLVVGVGEKEEEIKRYVADMQINDNVYFLGNRNDMAALYQAMDVFVLPSLFEGIPVVGIEAQFAGLPCFFSDRVPSEVKFNEETHFLSLDAPVQQWAEEILATQNIERFTRKENIVNSHYDIKVAKEILENYYLNLN